MPPERDEHSVRRGLIAEIDRLSRVLRRFLEFVRPHEPALERVDLAGTAERVAQLIRAQANGQGTTIRVDVHRGRSVLADPEQLVQVVLGITINALQALGEGGRVVLRTGRREREGETWCGILVDNDGPPSRLPSWTESSTRS